MELAKYSMGIGDRFGRQGTAQLRALLMARNDGVDVNPVWNKSHREHSIIGTEPILPPNSQSFIPQLPMLRESSPTVSDMTFIAVNIMRNMRLNMSSAASDRHCSGTERAETSIRMVQVRFMMDRVR